MNSKADHRVAMSNLVTERRAAGKPVWAHRITVNLSGLEVFKKRRDAWIKALTASAWYKGHDEATDLWNVVDEARDAESAEHFDMCLETIYDEADDDRVWIEVRH